MKIGATRYMEYSAKHVRFKDGLNTRDRSDLLQSVPNPVCRCLLLAIDVNTVRLTDCLTEDELVIKLFP
jgi:hypothetical protein